MNSRFLVSFRRLIAAILLIAVSGLGHAANRTIIESVDVDSMRGFLSQAGYEFVKVDSDGDIVAKFASTTINVILKDNNFALRSYFNRTPDMTLERINKWNNSKRFATISVDKDDDLMIQMDVDLGGGVTGDRVVNALQTYIAFLASMAKEFE